MALEEVTFVNTNGEEINISNIVNQMIDYYNQKLEVGETRVTDFNEGSEIRNLLEAFAVGIYALLEEQHEETRMAFISTAEGVSLDLIGEMPFINLPRVTGEYATGTVKFTLAEPQTNEIIIPEDTIVACSDTGLDFATTSECIISVGELSSEATIEAITIGADGNVASQSIDTIISDELNLELFTVTNETALEGGTDTEDDEEYRTRLLENIRADGFGTQGWYVTLCENVGNVHDVLLIDDAEYTKKVLVNGKVKPTTDSILLEVLTKLTDLDNKVINHSFTVDKPAYTQVNLSISLNVLTTLPDDDLQTMIQKQFDGGSFYEMEFDGLNINQSITKEDIKSALLILDDIAEVTSITSNDTEVTEITPSNNGVLQLGTVTFNQTEV